MRRFVRTFAYFGRVPVAAGVLGSLAAILLCYALHRMGGFPLVLVATLVLFGLGAWSTTGLPPKRADARGEAVVIDEVVGQLVALFPLSAGLWFAGAAPHVFPWPGWVGGFVVFRLLVALKPWPISWAARQEGGLGVMLDDLVAGLMTAVCIAAAAALAHGVLL